MKHSKRFARKSKKKSTPPQKLLNMISFNSHREKLQRKMAKMGKHAAERAKWKKMEGKEG